MVIGVGEQHRGVYWLHSVTSTQKVCHVSKMDSYQLWHRRLGHAPKQLLSSIPVVRNNNIHDVPCDVCFKAKQTRESFSLSNNNVAAVYDNDSGVDLPNNDLVRKGQTEVGEFTVRGSSRDLISIESTSGSSDISSPLEFGEHREPVNHHTDPSVRRSERVRQPSTRLRDYVCHTVHRLDPSYVPLAPSSPSVLKKVGRRPSIGATPPAFIAGGVFCRLRWSGPPNVDLNSD
ncbi:hypothetical protein Salat_1093800 [Sesamum alatum]|uniref:GAG-pre-integrase domain-containing protein n=1 Tax=Sesamum alatum TaxID=300844 RepID=A0AAE1YN61_9LAMI|nr:hypothetical protein Salat_1093800 [Sesamum alatum]